MRGALIIAIVTACAGCGSTPRVVPAPKSPHVPKLAAPAVGDPTARGADYLHALGLLIQPRWGQFLEDCRVRLPATHPLNALGLVATIELAIARDGKLVEQRPVVASGNGDFETAISDVLADAAPLPPPPATLASDDDLVHVRWQFARDQRQAGAATASILTRTVPLAEVVDRLLARGEVGGAARRADATLAERVILAALREALASSRGEVRLAAAEAIGRANVLALGSDVRALLEPTTEAELRVVAAQAVARLHDLAAIAPLSIGLEGELRAHPRVALANLDALIALGRGAEVGALVAAALPDPTALAALASVPVPEAKPKLAGWFAHGDARTRAAVCAGMPQDQALVRRGLVDGDATVRATCVLAVTTPSPRLTDLATDRDQLVRARAIAAIAKVDHAHASPFAAAAIRDRAAIVRAAASAAASPAELLVLAADPDADVRAAAYAQLGDGHVMKAALDPAPQVRMFAATAADPATLARLARDDSPAVATAATITVAMREGRAAATPHLLEQLAASPAGSLERVRIALAWLLAR